jgi:hypothetical protein
MAVMEPYKGGYGYYLWKYLPSKAGAAIFCVLFIAATIAQQNLDLDGDPFCSPASSCPICSNNRFVF